MSDLKRGDMVMVVKGCPSCGWPVGVVFEIEELRASKGGGFACGKCSPPGVVPIRIHGPDVCVVGSTPEDVMSLPRPWVMKLWDGEPLEQESYREGEAV